MGNRFSIEAAFDALQEIGRVFDGFVQSFVNPAVSDRLGLSRAEYLKAVEEGAPSHDPNNLPEYVGHPFDIINGNEPAFMEDDSLSWTWL